MSSNFLPHLPEEVTPEFLAAFDDAIEALEAACHFAISLSPKDRQRLRAFGSESEAFAQDMIEAAARHPELLPAYGRAPELERRRQATVELLRRVTRLDELRQRLWDTARVTGDSCVGLMLDSYQSLKRVAAVVGIEPTVERLERHFAQKVAAGRARGAKRRARAGLAADGSGPAAQPAPSAPTGG